MVRETVEIDISGNSLVPATPDCSSDKPNTRKYLRILEDKLNTDLGLYYWKKYTATAFWSQISTPINFAMTLLSALTTAQANTEGLIPQSIYAQITIGMLLLTTFNTFFRPYTQMTEHQVALQKWNAIGIEFELIYYSDLENRYTNMEDIQKMIKQYQGIQAKVNAQRQAEGLTVMNVITDLIHFVMYRTLCRRHKQWIEQRRASPMKNHRDATGIHKANQTEHQTTP